MLNLKKWLCLSLGVSCLWAGSLSARPVTEKESRQVVQQWLCANPHLMQVTTEPTIVEMKTATGQVLLRKVVYASGGALFVSADTRLTPILAVLTRGRVSDTHPMVRHLMADVETRLLEAPAEDDSGWGKLLSESPLPVAIHPLKVLDARWEGELDHWNQESFNRYGRWKEGTVYNRYTPNQYMAGCVAIAGCAIQQFYAFPTEQGVYTNSFCAVYDDQMRPHFEPLQTRPGAYNWSILPKQWKKPQTLNEEQSELLARIAANSGVITGTHYASTASGGSTYFLMEGLRKGAGYATGMEYCPSPSTPMDVFLSGLLYAQLRCGAPCVLDLGGRAGNHAVVAVGIAEDSEQTCYTRLFFGWGGSGDVWYALPTRGSFHSILGVGTLVSPKGACVPIYGTVLCADGTPAKEVWVTVGENRVLTDAAGRFATRVEPMENVPIEVGGVTRMLTLDADCLSRAAVEPWAAENPRAVSTECLLRALPQPITLHLP